MKYYRFLGEDEFAAIRNGDTLVNKNAHIGQRTSSVGFCFLREDSRAMGGMYEYGLDPDDPLGTALEMIGGCMGDDTYFVEFETDQDNRFLEGFGVYADAMSPGWYDRVSVNEYSVTEYSTDWLRPLKAWKSSVYQDYERYTGYQEVTPLVYAEPTIWSKYDELYAYLEKWR